MTLSEVQATSTNAWPNQSVVAMCHGPCHVQEEIARQRSNTKRRVIFPNLHGPTRFDKATTSFPIEESEKSADSAVQSQASASRSAHPLDYSKNRMTDTSIHPLLGRPPHPNSCTGSKCGNLVYQEKGTNDKVVPPHTAKLLIGGRSVVSPHPARRSVLFSNASETERRQHMPFLPSISNFDQPLARITIGKPEFATLESVEDFQSGVKVSVLSRFRPLPMVPFLGIDRLTMNHSPTPTSTRLPSILRTSRLRHARHIESIELVSKISSIGSDIPSLASSNMSCSDCYTVSPQSTASPQVAKCHVADRNKRICFNPRVWIREFGRTQAEVEATWFTIEEMEGFRLTAMRRIMTMEKQVGTKLIPTGTSRMVQLLGKSAGQAAPLSPSRALFSHQALCLDADSTPDRTVHRKRPSAATIPAPSHTSDIDIHKKRIFRCAVAEHEIRQILLVDAQEICRDLFSKGLKKMLPHVTVVTASHAKQALELVHARTRDSQGKRGFDVVIVEERLKLSVVRQESGSVLLRNLYEVTRISASKTLFIGVSADLRVDGRKLQESGAEVLWPKPPPRMDQQLRDGMLQALLVKRGRSAVAEQLFD